MEDRDPYWAVLWASAVAMAELLTSNRHLVQGARVCDVGCGLGVSGIVAALCGASHVDLLDREPVALQCALLSATASGLTVTTSAADFASTKDEAVAIRDLEVSLAAPHTNEATSSRSSEAVQGRIDNGGASAVIAAKPFDWYLAHEGPPYDVIIACDVLYESFAVSPLARVLPTMLAQTPIRPQRVLLTDPPKRASENRRRFLAELAERDSAMVVEVNKIVQQPFENGVTEVQVIVLRRKLGGETVGVPLTSVS